MAIPTQDGRYIARPIDWTVEESGKKKLPTFTCSFELFQYRGQDGWQAVNDLQITGYFYLILKDGNVNERQIKSLREALGWDGRSMATLANGAWGTTDVQLSLGSEEYEGKTRIKVQYINPVDYEPGHIEKKPEVVKSIASKYDNQLRALAGSAPAAAAKPPARPAVNNAPMNDALVKAARKSAWDAFFAANPGGTNETLAQPWKDQIKSSFPDKSSTVFTPEDWKKVQADIESPPEPELEPAGVGAEPPFGDNEFKDDDIPF